MPSSITGLSTSSPCMRSAGGVGASLPAQCLDTQETQDHPMSPALPKNFCEEQDYSIRAQALKRVQREEVRYYREEAHAADS